MNAPHPAPPTDKRSPGYLAGLFDRRPDEGVYRVNRSVYTDPELFELELANIFEGSWLFLCHESQLPQPYDWCRRSSRGRCRRDACGCRARCGTGVRRGADRR